MIRTGHEEGFEVMFFGSQVPVICVCSLNRMLMIHAFVCVCYTSIKPTLKKSPMTFLYTPFVSSC